MAQNVVWLDPHAFKKLLVEESDLKIFDVLPEEAFSRRHIPGSISASVYDVTFLDQVLKVAKPEEPVAIYGGKKEGKETLAAIAKLSENGFKHIFALKGGVESWVEAGLPLEGEGEVFLSAPIVPASKMTLDPKESHIHWTGRNPNGKHEGEVGLQKGFIKLSGKAPEGEIVVDMTTIKNHDIKDDDLNKLLVAHLSSSDFFWVEKFPKALLRITGFKVLETLESRVKALIDGTLELRGTSLPVSVYADLLPKGEGKWVIESRLDLDRTLWGADYGSDKHYTELQKHLVYDKINIDLKLAFS